VQHAIFLPWCLGGDPSMDDRLPDLRYDYYAAFVREAVLGPRRELSLVIERNVGMPPGRVKAHEPTVQIRFGGIANYDEVRSFFEHYPRRPGYAETLHHLKYDPAAHSRPGELFIRMEWDRSEESITIQCRNLSVVDRSSDEPS
jgi:hypothetical protein